MQLRDSLILAKDICRNEVFRGLTFHKYKLARSRPPCARKSWRVTVLASRVDSPELFPPFWTFSAKSSLVRKNLSSHKGLNSVGLWHALCACSKLKFPIWKPRLGHASTIRSRRKFPYTPLLIFLPDIAYIYIFFHSNLLWYLYLHYPPLYNISIWPGLRCGQHYMSVCIVKPYVLLTTMGDWRRREEF